MTFDLLVALEVCPTAPPGAQKYTDQITGYLLWGVVSLFVVGVVISIGAIVAGRIFSMPHASKAGIVGVVVTFLSAIAYLVLPSLIGVVTGTGCIDTPGTVKPSSSAKP